MPITALEHALYTNVSSRLDRQKAILVCGSFLKQPIQDNLVFCVGITRGLQVELH